jgi:hypothetical protein
VGFPLSFGRSCRLIRHFLFLVFFYAFIILIEHLPSGLGIGHSGFVGIHGLLIRFTLTCVYIGVQEFSWDFGAFSPYTMSESDIGCFYFKLERFFYWAFRFFIQ